MVTTATKPRFCINDDCDNRLTGRQRKYCSDACKARVHRVRHGAKSKAQRLDTISVNDPSLRRGDLYELLRDHEITDAILAGEYTMAQAADELGVSRAAMTRTIAAIVVDRRVENVQAALDPDEQRVYLGPGAWEMPEIDSDEFDTYVDALVTAFVAFRSRYFHVRPGRPFTTKAYHRRWIRSIIVALLTGGQQLILSPPRHGKSELMIHMAVWLIIRDPNIRIMWVGGSLPLAKIMVGSIKEHLERNEALATDFLGEGQSFKYKGKWSAEELTVATRTVIGQKTYTVVAVGWSGTILSRDCDLIILDDVEDDRSVKTAGTRSETLRKFTVSLESRNEAHTAVVYIGSRQHHDDLAGKLIANTEWNAIVEQAHDDSCTLDPDDLDAHWDCMLWPEKHNYTWWYKKRSAQMQLGVEYLFEMVYQNRASASSLTAFTEADIDRSLNRTRRLGDLEWFAEHEIMDKHLIAGIDPAAVGKQCYWLWLYDTDTNKAYMVDAAIDNGGGVERFGVKLREWKQKYGCSLWQVETNNIQSVFVHDERIQKLLMELGIAIESGSTGSGKHHTEYGLPGMARWFADDMIDLPYADVDAQYIVSIFKKQALEYNPDEIGKAAHRGLHDLLMSAWIPFPNMLELAYTHLISTVENQDASYSGYNAVSLIGDRGDMPW